MATNVSSFLFCFLQTLVLVSVHPLLIMNSEIAAEADAEANRKNSVKYTHMYTVKGGGV